MERLPGRILRPRRPSSEMAYSDFIIFADESGNPNMRADYSKYPIFVFSCCVFHRRHYRTAVEPDVIRLKTSYFGNPHVILHSRKVRHSEPPFNFAGDKQKRANFMAGLSSLIADAQFTVIANIVDLNKFKQMYPNTMTVDGIAFRSCVGRIYHFLQGYEQHELNTRLVIEARGKYEDARLIQAYQAMRSASFTSRQAVPDLEITFDAKRNNTAGVQLADLAAYPISQHHLNPRQSNRAWNIINPKLFRNPQGAVAGWGLEVLPKASEPSEC